jgi:hypothetical protein
MITTKPLFLLKNGEKFVQGAKTYTVYQHEGNMTEVLCNGKFWAWPNWNGISAVKVDVISH